MKEIKNLILDEERALYGLNDVKVIKCSFDGEKDGESALKECKRVIIDDCFFNLRYPMWHVDALDINNSNLTTNARAAIWYCNNIKINDTLMHGIKALRECNNTNIINSDIVSPEFGWKSKNIKIEKSSITSEYAFLDSSDIYIKDIKFSGKYSFQYVNNLIIENSMLDTKDAFWHSSNIIVKDSIVKGEYLGWYSNNIKFINCKIIGTQPLCYAKNIVFENCTTEDCDLSFENSIVDGNIIGHIDSIKNLLEGTLIVDSVGEVIIDKDISSKIIINKKEVV